MKTTYLKIHQPWKTENQEGGKSLIVPLKRTLQSIWRHKSLKILRNYYCGLGSCLLYHRVTTEKSTALSTSPYKALSVSAEAFEEQICYLSKNYIPQSLPDAILQLKNGTLSPRTVIITFDDGYKDNFLNALPILEKYSVPATVYVSTGFIEGTAELWWFEQEFIINNCNQLKLEFKGKEISFDLKTADKKARAIHNLNLLSKSLNLENQRELMMNLRSQCLMRYSYNSELPTWDELRYFDSHPLITIGAHTVNHPVLSQLEQSELESELRESKLKLEYELQHPIEHFAYPFGSRQQAAKREFEAARQSNFISAVSTRYGHLYHQHKNHLFNLPRIPVNYEDSMECLEWKLSGLNPVIRQYGKRVWAS